MKPILIEARKANCHTLRTALKGMMSPSQVSLLLGAAVGGHSSPVLAGGATPSVSTAAPLFLTGHGADSSRDRTAYTHGWGGTTTTARPRAVSRTILGGQR